MGRDMGEIFNFTDVVPVGGLDLYGAHMVVSCQGQVEVDNAVATRVEIGENVWFEDVYSVECQFFICILLVINPFVTIVLEVFPTDKEVLLIEE